MAPVARSAEKSWTKAMVRPWNQLTNLAEKHQCPVVVAGDLFHKSDNPAWLTNWAIRRLKELPFKAYGIPGQHDLLHHSYEDIRKTSYWTLVESGALVNLEPGKPAELESARLHSFPFGFPLKPLEKRHSLSLEIAIMHYFVWTAKTGFPGAPKEDRVKNVMRKMHGYDLLICGDNHKPFHVHEKHLGKKHNSPWHPSLINCLLPGNWIAHPSKVEGGSKVTYSGQAVEVLTKSGRKIRTTANHPILTTKGFLPSRMVNKSQELLSYQFDGHDTSVQDKDDRPSSVEDVFGSLIKRFGPTATRPAIPKEFHGDAIFFKSEVDVIGPQGKLLSYPYSEDSQNISEFMLIRSRMGTPQVPSSRSGHLSGLRVFSSSSSLIRSGGLSFPTFYPQRSHLLFGHQRCLSGTDFLQEWGNSFNRFFYSIAPRAKNNSSTNYGIPNDTIPRSRGIPLDLDTFAKGIDGLPGQVRSDQVIDVKHFSYHGEVYDFQTNSGIIITDSSPSSKGILISNCGGFGNRNHDEKTHRPRIWLIHDDGSVAFVKLDCSQDRWANVRKVATDIQGGEVTDEFVRELETLGDRYVDFAELVKRLIAERGVPKGTARMILEALEEGKWTCR